MAFKPLHDRVLVRRVQSEEKTKGGLIIPDTAKEKPAEGEVVALGEGARKDSGELIAPSVSVGDRVLFGGGFPVFHQGKIAGGLGVSGGTVEEDIEIATWAMNQVMGADK